MNILLGITGSVATIKLPELVAAIGQRFPEAHLKVMATEKSLYFVQTDAFAKQFPSVPILRDADEWAVWQRRGDPVLHIEVSGWPCKPKGRVPLNPLLLLLVTKVGRRANRCAVRRQYLGQGC